MKNKQQTNKHNKMETKDQKNKKLPWEAPKLIFMEVENTKGKNNTWPSEFSVFSAPS